MLILTTQQIEALGSIEKHLQTMQAHTQAVNRIMLQNGLNLRVLLAPGIGLLRSDVCGLLFEHESACNRAGIPDGLTPETAQAVYGGKGTDGRAASKGR